MTSDVRKTMLIAGGGLCFCLLPWAAILFGEQYLISLFTRILIYALAAVSLDLLIGYGGLISLGHAAFVGIGGYITAIFFHHSFEDELIAGILPGSENALLVWPMAVLAAAGLALLIGSLSLRTSGMHFIMITLAFAQMLYYFAVGLEKYGGDDGLSLYSRNQLAGMDLGSDMQFYFVCLFFLALFLFLADRLVKSRFGLVLRGASSSRRRINALGIPARNYKLICFVIGGAGAGLAGALLVNQTEYVSPGLLHWTMSGELMVMVLLGGLGSLFGPVLGAAVYLLLEETLAMYTEHWMVYLGPILIIVVLFAKRGLFGLLTLRE
ncbi:MAG: branched-chain amino acid ABC transporter permease [Desulfofustis sp.]|nr:branched-chain amino acid ABC transporter permease [Desulfofustis sp.]RZW23423.1 MAG: branched-chain amino acid ABC transporter permease [Desulfobulbaceae bacterium]